MNSLFQSLLISFLLFSFINFPSSAQDSATTQENKVLFRDFDWAISKEQVKEEESAFFIQENQNGLMYEDQLFHRRFNTAYFFHNDQLYRGVYSLQQPFKDQGGSYLANNKSYFKLYKQIVDDVKSQYGEPDKEVALPEAYSVNVNKFLDEIEQGKKTVLSRWKRGDVIITTALKGSRNKIKVLQIYEYKPILAEVIQAQIKARKELSQRSE